MTSPTAQLTALIDPSEPLLVWIETSWPGYQAQLEACEGFEKMVEANPEDGSRLIAGQLDCRRFNYLRLRSRLLAPAAQARFEAQMRSLAEPDSSLSSGAGTRIELSCELPYWALISTGMGSWRERLDEHPLSVSLGQGRYLIPRALFELRPSRPKGMRPDFLIGHDKENLAAPTISA